MTVNTQQLLLSVVNRPKLSSVDSKFMAAIWDSFVTWMAERLQDKVAVRCLDLGDFVLRRDKIGPMEFLNPMFILNEGFAHRHGLHDRRPKQAALESAAPGRPDGVDLNKVTQMASERLGEVVLRETVENALKDVVERLGELCADDKAHGTVSVDLLFAKLVCENKSVELHFLSSDERGRALERRRARAAALAAKGAAFELPPPTPAPSQAPSSIRHAAASGATPGGGAGARGLGSVSELGEELGIVGEKSATTAPGSVVSGRGGGRTKKGYAQSDPPLQRPRRSMYRKAEQRETRDVLLSHASQIAQKATKAKAEHEEEVATFAHDMTRLRGEMVHELEEKVARRAHMRDVALIHQVQAHEKALRDREARGLGEKGDNLFFPFRTEEEVAEQTRRSNKLLKANLDQQLRERAEAKASMARAKLPSIHGGNLTSLPMDLPDPPPPPDKGAQPTVALQAAIDEAYDRYSSFLNTRATAEQRARAYAEEQTYLSEQAELLKREESKRRLGEMSNYLKQQIEHKSLKEQQTKLERRAYRDGEHSSMLPKPATRNFEKEAHRRDELRRVLDAQVAEKERRKREQAQEDKAAQAEMLALVSHELRESRVRDQLRKHDEKTVLREAWDRQKALKDLEKQVATS